ncbi:hypothetical protein ACIBG8_01515 [Nonomuraea sp. NPDC050556]|uniref:hypothetical protein n=1 Tax=Nonomuraea sp. NPDC050556 TaxID=3364369 RepID=UPI0037BDEA8B
MDYRPDLRLGAIAITVGAVAVCGFRLAHGDLPAADAPAALRFIAHHPFYAGVHLGTIAGVLLWAGGVVALTGTLSDPLAVLSGRLARAATLIGAAIFITDFTIDGVTGQDLAHTYANAAPADQAGLELVAHTAFAILRGTSLTSIIILWGVTLILLGYALGRDGYAGWLGWSAVAIGALTAVAAGALLFQPTLFPGALLYGALVSIVVQLWSIALGATMWRRSRVAHSAIES